MRTLTNRIAIVISLATLFYVIYFVQQVVAGYMVELSTPSYTH